MLLQHIETIFSRASWGVMSLKKNVFLFSVLLLCGSFTSLNLTLAHFAGSWLKLLCIFSSIGIIFSVLLPSGVFFARMYYHEIKGEVFTYRTLFVRTLRSMLALCQVAAPTLLGYLMIWMMMGVFYGLQKIPYIGSFITLLLSFTPFLLMLLALLLGIFSMGALFFLVPLIAFKKLQGRELITHMMQTYRKHLLTGGALFISALVPCLIWGLMLYLSLIFSEGIFIGSTSVIYFGIRSFILMIPFVAALTPLVLFFFNFSVESYNFVRKLEKAA